MGVPSCLQSGLFLVVGVMPLPTQAARPAPARIDPSTIPLQPHADQATMEAVRKDIRVRKQRVEFSPALLGLDAGRLNVFRLTDKKWAMGQDAENLGAGRISYRADAPVALRAKTPAKVRLSKEVSALPLTILWPSDADAAGETATMAPLEIVMKLQQDPLTWEQADLAYATNLEVAVRKVSTADPRPDLDITVLFTTRGAQTSTTPSSLHFTAANVFQETRLRVKTRALDGAVVATVLTGNEDDCAFKVEPEFGGYRVSCDLPEIYGLGLETVPLTVVRCARDGNPFVAITAEPFEIKASKGSVKGVREFKSNSDTCALILRSRGLGDDVVGATRGSIAPEGSMAATVHYRVPWLMFGLSVLGGAIGQGILLLKTLRRRRWKSIVSRLVIGSATAVVITFAFALGLGDREIANKVVVFEAGAFTIGVLAGISGPAVLLKLAGAVGMGSSDGEAEK